MDSGRKIKDKLSHLINRWLFLKNQGTDDYLLTICKLSETLKKTSAALDKHKKYATKILRYTGQNIKKSRHPSKTMSLQTVKQQYESLIKNKPAE